MSAKTYKISQLFKTSWEELSTRDIATLIDLRHKLEEARKAEEWKKYGFIGIAILRLLRKNGRLVAKVFSKVDEHAAVDCLNDLRFIHKPWYHFPKGEKAFFKTPGEKLHNRTFNQFIYADAAFSKFCVIEHKARTIKDYKQQEAIQAVNELIGIIYCDPKKFDEQLITERGLIIANQVEEFEKAVILHTFANVREYIVKHRCPTLFPSSNDDVERPPVYTGQTWYYLRFDVSETPTFQGMDTTKKAWLYEVLDLLEKKAQEAAKPQKA